MSQACTATDVKKAMGNRIGDYMVIENQWASVSIIKEAPDTFTLLLRGEGDGSEHPNAYRALGRALEILAEYETGRHS